MRVTSLKLATLLELLSYQIIITAFGFALAGGFLYYHQPAVSRAMTVTASIFILLSLVSYRLSNHET